MDANVLEYVAYLLYALPGLIIGFVLHELAHAVTAVRLGDPTPQRMGRITLDPRQHIDPLGFGMLITVGFGWAKPVTFSTMYIRTAGRQALVAAAGPLTNLVLAGIFGLALRVLLAVSPADLTDRVYSEGFVNGHLTFGHGGADAVLYLFLAEAFFINVVLFIFNSIPIPPLDGYAVARGLFGHVVPGLFHFVDRNRQMVYGLAFVVLVVLPLSSGGSFNPLWSFIMHVNDSVFTSVAGASPFLGADLPRLWMLFPPQTST
jgi:Zn-dependent protease